MKYTNNLLPTLDKLSIRNPKNFLNARCVACLAGVEDSDHLLKCVVYQKLWKNIEEEVIQLMMNESSIFITNKRKLEELRILLEEANSNDPYKKRKELLLGIISRDAEVRLREIAGSRKKAERVAITWICIAWKVFYTRLWCFRCEIVKDWEKQNYAYIALEREQRSLSKVRTRTREKENLGIRKRRKLLVNKTVGKENSHDRNTGESSSENLENMKENASSRLGRTRQLAKENIRNQILKGNTTANCITNIN